MGLGVLLCETVVAGEEVDGLESERLHELLIYSTEGK